MPQFARYVPANPILQLTLPRCRAALDRIRAKVWTVVGRPRLRYGGSFERPILSADAGALTYVDVTVPFIWGRLFDQGWFEVEWSAEDGDRYLHWQEQGGGHFVYRWPAVLRL